MAHHKQLDSILQEWERLTLTGNTHFQQHAWREAYRCYMHSMELVETYLQRDPHRQAWRLVRFFVLACQNTAHVAEKMGKERDAEHYFSHAHFVLLSLINFSQTQVSIRQQALLEITSSLAALREFLLRKGKYRLVESIQEETERVLMQRGSVYPLGHLPLHGIFA